jgi:hypothetical protein
MRYRYRYRLTTGSAAGTGGTLRAGSAGVGSSSSAVGHLQRTTATTVMTANEQCLYGLHGLPVHAFMKSLDTTVAEVLASELRLRSSQYSIHLQDTREDA